MTVPLHDALTASGIPVPPASINTTSGDFIRYGKNNRYWLKQADGVTLFGDWVAGESYHHFEDGGQTLSPAEIQARRAKLAALKRDVETERLRQQEEAAGRALAMWENLAESGISPYLARKQISAHGVRFEGDTVVVPLRDAAGKLWSLQKIHPDGQKRFFPGGRIAGCFHTIGTPQGAAMVYVVEGYATGASVHLATGCPVIVAFNAGNLEPALAEIRKAWPGLAITIAADNDQWTEGNPGKTKAGEAARKHGSKVILPHFSDTAGKPTDWNDLHVLEGLEAVRAKLRAGGTGSAAQTEMETEIIARLAALPPLEYDREAKAAAKALRVSRVAIDKAVKAHRAETKGFAKTSDKDTLFPNVELWPEPVNAAAVLDEIVATIRRFIVCEPETAIAASLWCAFTWFMDYVQIAPLAVITAPEMRCGKSQLLDVISRLSCRPLMASNISPAAMFRVIEAHRPTLLIDEADTFFKANEELRGVVNSGHTRQSAYIIRTVGDDHEPKQFSTWGAKAISGIGSLAETIRDRAIILELRRKLPSELAERLRHVERGLFDRLASQLARLAHDAGHTIEAARPALPDALNDRAQDNWEPLLAIADYAEGAWPEIARETAVKLSGIEREPVSLSTELLADICEVFETKRIDKISTADLLQALTGDDLKPWATFYRGKPMTASQLAKRLKEYGIKSKNLKFGYDVKKGFEREQFDDVFARYLTSHSTSEIPATPLPILENQAPVRVSTVAAKVAGSGYAILPATGNPLENIESSVVAAKLGEYSNSMVEVEI